MILRPPSFTLTDTLVPYTTLFRSIEGIAASVAEAAAVIDDEKPDSLEEETWRALTGYRIALTYVLQVHDDPHFELNAQFIKSLHFMMMNRSEEHTSELESLMRTSYAFFCLKHKIHHDHSHSY